MLPISALPSTWANTLLSNIDNWAHSKLAHCPILEIGRTVQIGLINRAPKLICILEIVTQGVPSSKAINEIRNVIILPFQLFLWKIYFNCICLFATHMLVIIIDFGPKFHLGTKFVTLAKIYTFLGEQRETMCYVFVLYYKYKYYIPNNLFQLHLLLCHIHSQTSIFNDRCENICNMHTSPVVQIIGSPTHPITSPHTITTLRPW
jgi:hypothetical protein